MNNQEKLQLKELRDKPLDALTTKDFWELQHLIMLEILAIPGVKGGKREK